MIERTKRALQPIDEHVDHVRGSSKARLILEYRGLRVSVLATMRWHREDRIPPDYSFSETVFDPNP